MNEWKEENYDYWDDKIDKFKKYSALLLLLVNVVVFIACIFTNGLLALLFLGNSYIIIIYLKKFHMESTPTTKRKWKFWKKEKDED